MVFAQRSSLALSTLLVLGGALCAQTPAPSSPVERHPVAMVEMASGEAAHGQARMPGHATGVRAHFPAGRSVVDLPFRLTSNKIIVPVRINGQGPFDFVLDTGASSALFDAPEEAASLDVEIVGQAMVAGAGSEGPKPISLADNVTLEVGGVELRGSQLAITPAGGPALMPGSDWQGVFGDQLFSSTVVEIDWQRERIRLHAPDRYVAPADVVAVPLRVGGGHVYVEVALAMEDAPAKTVELVVDTGANHALALSPSAGKRPSDRIEGTVLGYGLSGVLHGDMARVRSLRIGETTFENVLASFPENHLSRLVAGGVDGNLGADILRRFDTTFDYANHRLLLRENKAVATPFSFSTSGIYVRPWLDDQGHAIVEDVLASSPAARRGIAAGDRIVAIGGRAMSTLTLDELREHLRSAPGVVLELTLLRDGERQNRSLPLEKLL